jgi:hypothetical protein
VPGSKLETEKDGTQVDGIMKGIEESKGEGGPGLRPDLLHYPRLRGDLFAT